MEFPIQQTTIYKAVTVEEVLHAIETWSISNNGRPGFCLMHPDTAKNFSDLERTRTNYILDRRVASEIYGVKIIRSEDIKPNAFHLCGK